MTLTPTETCPSNSRAISSCAVRNAARSRGAGGSSPRDAYSQAIVSAVCRRALGPMWPLAEASVMMYSAAFPSGEVRDGTLGSTRNVSAESCLRPLERLKYEVRRTRSSFIERALSRKVYLHPVEKPNPVQPAAPPRELTNPWEIRYNSLSFCTLIEGFGGIGTG